MNKPRSLSLLIALLGSLLVVSHAPAGDMTAYRDAAGTLNESLDETTWSLDAFSLAMAVEELDTISARLQAHFSTQVYAGVLRGGDGAFAARSGNAYDQALAAIRVLNEAGYLTRIARTQLDDANIDALLAATRSPKFGPAVADSTAMRQAMTGLGRVSGEPSIYQALTETLSNGWPAPPPSPRARTIGSRLADSLDTGIGTQARERLRADAADYVWIQVRRSGTDNWRDLHLAFRPVSPLEPAQYLDSPLPEELLHRIGIRFQVETREGERFRRDDLMARQHFPVANLGRRPLTLGVLPDALITGAVGSQLDQSTYYYPLLDNEMAPSAKTFTAGGFVVEASVIAEGGGVADVFATVAERGTRATDALAGLGSNAEDDEPPPTVRETTAVIIELTYQPPGDVEPRVYTRRVIDRIGAERRAQGAISASDDPPQFAGRWSLHAITGDVSPSEMLSRQIDRLDGVGAEAGRQRLSNPAETAGLANLFHRGAEAGVGDSATGYRYQPLLMIAGMAIHDNIRQRLSLDILQTGLRVVGRDGTPDWPAALRAGVAETMLESGLMDNVPRFGTRIQREGAWSVLENAGEWQWLNARSELKDSELPAHVIAALESDLEHGRWAAVVAGPQPAWWRLDPDTGAVIGVNHYGQGGEMAEYLAVLDAAVTSALGIYGALQCGEDLCCQAANAAWTTVGFAGLGFGGALATKLNWADEFMSGLIGFAAGTSAGAAGLNPLDNLCD